MSGGGPRPPGNGGSSSKKSASKPVKPKPAQIADGKSKGKRA